MDGLDPGVSMLSEDSNPGITGILPYQAGIS